MSCVGNLFTRDLAKWRDRFVKFTFLEGQLLVVYSGIMLRKM